MSIRLDLWPAQDVVRGAGQRAGPDVSGREPAEDSVGGGSLVREGGTGGHAALQNQNIPIAGRFCICPLCKAKLGQGGQTLNCLTEGACRRITPMPQQ